jgi:hypothetical protein
VTAFEQEVRMRRLIVLAALLLPIVAGPAAASQLIDRNATRVKLAVNGRGEALLTYTANGKLKHVLAWGAVNAVNPTSGGKQVAFRLDYAGGYGKYKRPYWQTFGAACAKYTGPPLAWLVAACTAPDGSSWALQAWQRALPDYGAAASPAQAVMELHLSHWTGPLPVLTVKTDWAYKRYDHIYGSFTYNGSGVYGFRATTAGQPLDTFGRNLYVDTRDSAYGAGWKRENSFLTHQPNGTFCYGFFSHGAHPVGNGAEYRATIIGPGVTPDVMWQGAAPGPYNATTAQAANLDQRTNFADATCTPDVVDRPG